MTVAAAAAAAAVAVAVAVAAATTDARLGRWWSQPHRTLIDLRVSGADADTGPVPGPPSGPPLPTSRAQPHRQNGAQTAYLEFGVQLL